MPSRANFLRAREVPVGISGNALGDTLFASVTKASGSLGDQMNVRLKALVFSMMSRGAREN